MITANADECLKSLQEYKLEVERKLKYMVAGFAQDVARAASDATRKGHVSEGGNTQKYLSYYKTRSLPPPVGAGIAPIEGFHKGAWTYTEGTLTFNPVIFDVATMLGQVDHLATVNYKIGDSFTIGAKGPAYEMLQNLDDITGVADNAIKVAYKSNLKQYFDEG